MFHQNLLYSTKTILSYLINNSPSFHTVDSIHLDFCNYAGIYIPLFDLGYSYLVTFLQSIPDVLEVDPVTFVVRPAQTNYSPAAPHNEIKNCNPFQWSRPSHKPMALTFPRAMPWTRPNQSPSESSKRMSKALTIKKPDSYTVKDDASSSPPFPLGPRTYGDGKCSSLDSITTDPELEPTAPYKPTDVQPHYEDHGDVAAAFVKTSTPPKYFDDVMNDEPNVKDFDDDGNGFNVLTSVRDGIDKNLLELKIEQNLPVDAISELQTPLTSTSATTLDSPFDETAPPPPYSVMDETHVFDYDRDYYQSSPEEKASQHSSSASQHSNDSAIPFTFTEADEDINMLNSHFLDEHYGCKYETTNIGDIMKVGSVYELYVSEVHNPYKFWFQLDDEDPNPVEELQENLDLCYQLTDSIPNLISEEHMRKGYACAALYCHTWHRGEIIGQPENGRVNIFFVDYGTVDKVAVGSVRYLLNSFCSLPKMCHRGTLDFVKPIDCRWSTDTTSLFIGMVSERKLIAGVSDIDVTTNSVRLYLMDSANNVNLNYKLVKEGHAFPDDPRSRYHRHIADVQPSFDSLEKGEYATYADLAYWMEGNYDFEKYAHLSIVEGFDCVVPEHIPNEEKMKRMQDYRIKIEEAKSVAQKRDATIFLQLFENILNNPFLNGVHTDAIEAAPNPFLD